MDKNGPIVLIDDDDDDLHLFIDIFSDMNLQNEVHLFKNPSSVVSFLQRPEVNPFMIISDISMPVKNGFELREILRTDPLIAPKNVPHLFFSTTLAGHVTTPAFRNEYQGIFKKPTKRSDWKSVLEAIVTYWKLSVPPE